MSERYSKLFALSENLYSAGAPVVIAAGALQKDNQTGKVFAQLKIRNIQDKVIKAATVKITPFDTVGKPLGGTVDYQYLDLSAKRDTDFGQKTPVMLKEAATRSFAAFVSEVIFSDNSIWTASNEAWEPLSAPVTPDKEFINGELAKQYRVKYGTDCTCVFKKEKDLWRCACGAVNHDSEMNCHTCQRAAAALAALNVEELKADRDKRLAAEQKKAAEEKAAAEAQAKKTKKIAMIAAPIVVAAIVAAVLISGRMEKSAAYNAAVALAEAGQYDEAIAAFTELGEYKDSAEQIRETQYAQAVHLVEDGEYNKATSIFTALGDYKDSKDSAEQSANAGEYQDALGLLDAGRYGEARAAFEALGDYKDARTYVESFVMRITSITSGSGVTYYRYDEYGDLVSDGENTYTYSADRKTVTWEWKYSTYTSTIIYTYDDQGMLVESETEPKSGGWSSAFTYEYNTDGTIAARHESAIHILSGDPFYEETITYEYGSGGHVIKLTMVRTYASGSTDLYYNEYTYENGQLAESTTDYLCYEEYAYQNGRLAESTTDSSYKSQYTWDWIYAPNADGPYIFPFSGAEFTF